jgi:transcriptional regulator with XRE-family HTH domain
LDARAEIGRRIAGQRRRRGLSQAVLAQLVGRSESWLSQVERELRSVDRHSVLVRLAEILGVEVGWLTPDEAGGETVKYEPVAAIREAMTRYGALPGVVNGRACTGRRPHLRWLSHEMRRANGLYQAARYDEAGRLLPGLIDAVEEARLSCTSGERRAADTVRALVYHSATMTLSRVGEAELAWTAADRSLAAAEAADRPLLASALRRGESLDVDRLGPGLLGRRSQVLLDLARAYGLQRKDAAAVNTLLRAERVSPELVRYDSRTNELLTELVRREHRVSTPELRGLAHRAGVI